MPTITWSSRSASRSCSPGSRPFSGGHAARPPAVQRSRSRAAWPTSSGNEIRFDDGGRCELSERERQLLHYLACHAGRAISRDELLAQVWGLNPAGITTRTIDMHIARLREKLHDDPASPRIVLTVRGQGYMLAAEGPP